MNDKFLEILSKSSGRTITRPYDGSLLIKLDLPELEKFAELVVKECIMLCEEWIEIDKDLKKTKSWVGVDPEIGPEFCIGSIKNHFGVENET